MATIKTIGNSGQISIGKEYAGRNVLVDQIEQGVWIVKLGKFIPDSEKWLYQANINNELDEAISWAEKTPPKSSDLNELENHFRK